MIEIKTEELIKPLSNDSNLTPVYNRLQKIVNELIKKPKRRNDYYSNKLRSDLIYNIYKGKQNAVKDFFAKYDKEYKIIKLANIDTELVKQYEDLRSGYGEFEKNIQFILNCVKIGESQEVAIKKLVKMTETVKYFDLGQLKLLKALYFYSITEEDILAQINKFDGYVEIFPRFSYNASLHVEFTAGKVVNVTLF